MAIVHRTTFTKNITNSVDEILIVGNRGGILIDLVLNWAPYTFIDKGLETEQIRDGAIHCLILDSGTGRSPIGQANLTVPSDDHIVIPTSGSWSWSHPESAILKSSVLFGKLSYNASALTDPVGLLRGHLILRFFADQQKSPLIAHSVAAEAKFVAFETQVA